MRFLIFFITFLMSMVYAIAQNNCIENLGKAQNAFEAGRIEEIPALIHHCIKNEYNNEQKGLAYKLLAITYLYDKDEAKADEAMLQLLRVNPLFKPDFSNDPSEFISLFNAFRTTPVLKIGFSAGSSFFGVREVNRHGLENLNTETESYSGKWGVVIGLDVEVPLHRKWSLFSTLQYSGKKYAIENSLMSFNELDINETQNWIDFFLMAQYYLNDQGIRPFVRLGGYGGYLLSAQATYITNQENINDIEGPAEDIRELRTEFNYGMAGDIGLAYSFGRSVIDLSVRMTYALNNFSDAGNRYSDFGNKLALTYGYRDNDFYANFLSITAGYKIMIFNPKKLY